MAHEVMATVIPGMARAIQQIYGTFQEIVIFYNPISVRVSYSLSLVASFAPMPFVGVKFPRLSLSLKK